MPACVQLPRALRLQAQRARPTHRCRSFESVTCQRTLPPAWPPEKRCLTTRSGRVRCAPRRPSLAQVPANSSRLTAASFPSVLASRPRRATGRSSWLSQGTTSGRQRGGLPHACIRGGSGREVAREGLRLLVRSRHEISGEDGYRLPRQSRRAVLPLARCRCACDGTRDLRRRGCRYSGTTAATPSSSFHARWRPEAWIGAS